MGCCICKRLLLFFLLFFLIKNTVDFSTKEFDPLRHRIDVSIDKITSNQYYHEYIDPLNAKYQPVLNKIQSKYIIPAYQNTNSFVVDNYNNVLSHHVDTVVSKIRTSPIYQKSSEYTDKIQLYYRVAVSYVKDGLQKTFESIAVGYNYSEKYFNIASNHIVQNYRITESYIKKQWTVLLPYVANFYEDRLLPYVKTASAKTIKGLKTAFKFVTYNYRQHVGPFVQTYIFSNIKLLYNKYLAHHVNVVKFQVSKYYTLFRVQQTLSLSKNLLTNSYDQLMKYYESAPGAAVEVSIEENDEDVEESVEDADAKAEPIDEKTQIPLETESSNDLDTTNNSDNLDDEVVLSLFEEIVSWKTFIHETVDNIFKNFDTTVEKLESEALDELTPKVKDLLRDFAENLNKDYAEVNKQIYNIDSKEVQLENGEVVNLDKDGKILDNKITRDEFRAYLNEAKEVAPTKSDEIFKLIMDRTKQLENDIDEERKIFVDIYEEFAEVAINEFSKKMMYSTFSNSFNKVQQVLAHDDENAENLEDWKEYVKVKKYLINERETLINKSHKLAKFNKYLSEIQVTLQTLVAEAGNFYAIARARANIEFQTREAAERELQSKIEANEEYTITSSILKFVTLTQGEDGELQTTDIVKIETPEEEELSDDDSESYETPDDLEDLDEIVDGSEENSKGTSDVEEEVEEEEIESEYDEHQEEEEEEAEEQAQDLYDDAEEKEEETDDEPSEQPILEHQPDEPINESE